MRDSEASGDADPDSNDHALLARIGRGDQAAFAALYDRYANGVFGTTLRFIRDRSIAAEVVQDTFMAVWQRGDQFNAASGSVIGWMLGIARNRAIDRLRAESRRPPPAWARPGGESGDGRDAANDHPDHAPRPASDDPAREVDRRWLRAVIQTVLTEIRPDEREILVLAYDHELSQSEIAVRLGIPIGTVKSRTRRAMARLRLRLEDIPDLRPGTYETSAAPQSGLSR